MTVNEHLSQPCFRLETLDALLLPKFLMSAEITSQCIKLQGLLAYLWGCCKEEMGVHAGKPTIPLLYIACGG